MLVIKNLSGGLCSNRTTRLLHNVTNKVCSTLLKGIKVVFTQLYLRNVS